ncbi:hypothetical protein EJ08DRAFT_25042 [Tothia fuscella]|uniref:Uncharacterized protein n=1 Tax=Tothia fuscella TaxID=1048955 RepID=A0A9P4TSM0_9PEZI|nr:hypothetical protein EJ08DRAFT_25042 [Tothia fuscella]
MKFFKIDCPPRTVHFRPSAHGAGCRPQGCSFCGPDSPQSTKCRQSFLSFRSNCILVWMLCSWSGMSCVYRHLFKTSDLVSCHHTQKKAIPYEIRNRSPDTSACLPLLELSSPEGTQIVTRAKNMRMVSTILQLATERTLMQDTFDSQFSFVVESLLRKDRAHTDYDSQKTPT